MTLVPLALLIGLEIALRLAGYGYNSNFFLPRRIGSEDYFIQNEDFSRRFFPGEVSRQPAALRMQAHKPAGTLRIFVLGESAAMGDPEPSFGPARHMEALLRLRYPATRFEIVNVAYTAINSHVILPLARECARHDGDLWIVYMGNNEMVGPFGAATVFGAQAPPRNYVRLSLALQRMRVGQLCRSLATRFQKPSTAAPSWGGMQMFLQNQVAPDSPKRAAAYKNFAGNLEEIVATGLDSGARIVLSTVAVNLRESPPFASFANPQLPATTRIEFDAALARGRAALTNGVWDEAAAAFAKATELEPTFADAHYQRALCQQHTGDTLAARKEFQLACDNDALPFRADRRINEAIRASAGQHAGGALQLLEAPDAIARSSGAPPCGNETFYEHVHFNFDGSYRLGLAWAQSVERLAPAGTLGQPAADWATQEQSERRLGLTDWNRKLVVESVLRRLQQPPLSSQPNNAERLQKLHVHEQSLLAAMDAAAVARARAIHTNAIAAQPDDHFLHEVYGNFLQLTGDLPGATREWQLAGQLLPHDFLPWFQMGTLQAQQKQHTQAQENLRTALRLRPGLVEGWAELGRSLGAEQHWEPALDAFQRARQLRPQDPGLWASEAKVLAALGRTAEAIAAYRRAIEIKPNYWEACAALGDLYSQAGQLPEAVAQYEAAIRARPDYAIGHLNLGVMFARQGRVPEAIPQFQEALRLEPNNATAADYLRRVQTYQQKHADKIFPNP